MEESCREREKGRWRERKCVCVCECEREREREMHYSQNEIFYYTKLVYHAVYLGF